MAANISPIFPLTPTGATQTIVAADTTTAKTIITGGTNGTRVDSVAVSSTDTAAQVLNIIINDGTNDRQVGTINIPLGSGTVLGNPAISLLTTSSLPWLPSSGSIFLKTGWVLKLSAQTTITAAKTISITAFAGDY